MTTQRPRLPLEFILARCEEDGDCLIWKGLVCGSGSPRCTTSRDKKRVNFQVRREMWEIKYGPVPPKHVLSVSCGNPRCLCHLEAITKRENLRRVAQRPDVKLREVIVATGVEPRMPHLDGIDHACVASYADVLSGRVVPGKRVANAYVKYGLKLPQNPILTGPAVISKDNVAAALAGAKEGVR